MTKFRRPGWAKLSQARLTKVSQSRVNKVFCLQWPKISKSSVTRAFSGSTAFSVYGDQSLLYLGWAKLSQSRLTKVSQSWVNKVFCLQWPKISRSSVTRAFSGSTAFSVHEGQSLLCLGRGKLSHLGWSRLSQSGVIKAASAQLIKAFSVHFPPNWLHFQQKLKTKHPGKMARCFRRMAESATETSHSLAVGLYALGSFSEALWPKLTRKTLSVWGKHIGKRSLYSQRLQLADA